MSTQFPGFVSPVADGSTVLRVDQGVDYDTSSNVMAIGSGVITRVSGPGSFAGGTGQAVYETLDHPIVIAGRSYSQVYYAERVPLVKVGDRVPAGWPVMGPGSNEIGFARNNSPACPLVGGLGAGTQPTVCGEDFHTFYQHVNAIVLPTPNPRLAPPGALAPSGHKGYADLRRSVASHLPTALLRAQRADKATRSALRRRRKLTG